MEPTHLPSAYPATITVDAPVRFEPAQLLLRVLVCMALGMLQRSGNGLFGLLYLGLPLAAAILIAHRTGPGYIERDLPWLVAVLEWLLALCAYLMLLTDKFPLDAHDRSVRLYVTATGTPSVGGALARLVTTLPHVFALAVLGIASFLISVLGAIGILVNQRLPEPLHAFQRGVLMWLARVSAYHVSLVATYPPFTLRASGSAPEGEPHQHATNAA
jgi:hypothetical protein